MAGTLTITSPATDSQTGFSTSSVPVTWSFAGTSGATQTQRRVTATPVGGGAAVFDTGMAASTATTQTVTGLATGVSYNVVVSIIDSAGATVSATRVVVSNYQRPLPATLVLTPAEQGVTVAITNPSDGQRPAVTTNDIYRRPTGQTGSWTLLGSVGPNATFVDYLATANVGYDYFVRSNGSIDSSTYSVTAAAMLGSWVHELGDTTGSTLQHFFHAAEQADAVDLETAFHAFVGRTYPVPEVGVARNDVLTVAIRLPPDIRHAMEEKWRDWKRRAITLYFRNGRSKSRPVNIDGPVSISPDGPGGVVTVALRRVDYQPTQLPAASYSSQTNVDGGYGVGGYGSNGYGL